MSLGDITLALPCTHGWVSGLLYNKGTSETPYNNLVEIKRGCNIQAQAMHISCLSHRSP